MNNKERAEKIAKLWAEAEVIYDGLRLKKEDEPILRFFSYAHLPEKLQPISMPFCLLACEIVERLPRCAERTVALRKLLESKDAAVRAAL